MQITAAVSRVRDAPLELEQVELDDPREDEILVRMVAVGICGGDLAVVDGLNPTALPAVLGHEGAGIVQRVGDGVTTVVAGDPVVLSFNNCGSCAHCREARPAYCDHSFPLNWGGRRPDGSTAVTDLGGNALSSNFFGQSSFATYALSNVRNTIKVAPEVPLELSGPMGCGFGTGAGTVLNALKPGPDSTVVILGAGAVAFSALFAAKIAGVGRVIVAARRAAPLTLATELGADVVIDTSTTDLAEALKRLGGVDFAIDTTGSPAVLEATLAALKPDGTLAILGAGHDQELTVVIPALIPGRVIRGVPLGDPNPPEFIPYLIQQYEAGNFPVDRLVGYYPLTRINDAIADSRSGKTIKPILTM